MTSRSDPDYSEIIKRRREAYKAAVGRYRQLRGSEERAKSEKMQALARLLEIQPDWIEAIYGK